ncbi:hypothetical protein [Rhodococcus sp. B50]|uniref:hypothetical protein n=1 Tax=Rhodococcus sp. B50 TaxID=2682847 RepID=UPI001BD5563D|nr:hypothetical protein [Rhodococcus sp. B50]
MRGTRIVHGETVPTATGGGVQAVDVDRHDTSGLGGLPGVGVAGADDGAHRARTQVPLANEVVDAQRPHGGAARIVRPQLPDGDLVAAGGW